MNSGIKLECPSRSFNKPRTNVSLWQTDGLLNKTVSLSRKTSGTANNLHKKPVQTRWKETKGKIHCFHVQDIIKDFISFTQFSQNHHCVHQLINGLKNVVIHRTQYNLAIKKNPKTWMNLEDIMISKRGQSQSITYYITIYVKYPE